LLSGCAGDYPLPPTACDDYCHGTRDLQCGLFYYPAQCVSQCERDLKGDEACREQLTGVLSCFATSNAAERRCRAYESYPWNEVDASLCEAALGELEICSSTLRIESEPAQPPQPQL
jgi:hypothetical protein